MDDSKGFLDKPTAKAIAVLLSLALTSSFPALASGAGNEPQSVLSIRSAQIAAAASAGERTISDGTYLIAPLEKKSRVIAAAGNSKASGANAELAAFAANKSQAYSISYDGKGYYTIANAKSGNYLAPASGSGKSGINVANYKLNKSNDLAKWRISKAGRGYSLVNKATGLALSSANGSYAAGTNITANAASSSNKQRFLFESPSDVTPKVTGTYYICMKSNKRIALGPKKGSRKEGMPVKTAARKNTNLVRFDIKKAGSGLVYLKNTATGRMASLKSKKKSNGVKVVLRDKKGTKIQKWRIICNNDFTLSFENAYSHGKLNVAGGKSKAGAKINVRASSTTKASQKFTLKGTKKKQETVTIGVPCYLQNPQLPTGCESVAITNALRYWGFKLGKTTIANKWMPYGSDGVYDFIGNPYNSSGWIICAPGIAKTANSYLKSRKSKVKAKTVHGKSLKSLRKYLNKGYPVVVWTTIGMGSPGGTTWRHGYPLRSNNHAVVLSGYNPKTGDYLVADSLAGKVWRNGSRFTWLYNEMGKQAVVLKR